MTRGRLEAFSDGVIAIIITIMVLELRPPHGHALEDLIPLLPKFLSYLLSFVFVAIYWNNHHHLLHTVERVNGRILWANMHLLFWLSTVPFVTAWMDEGGGAPVPVALYGGVLLLCAISYSILVGVLVAAHGPESRLARALGSDLKSKLSLAAYVMAIPLAFVSTWLSFGLFVAVALTWFVPDLRLERTVERGPAAG
ncbi:MAG: TMEM175 family protein [Anaeromyxobacter sp.]